MPKCAKVVPQDLLKYLEIFIEYSQVLSQVSPFLRRVHRSVRSGRSGHRRTHNQQARSGELTNANDITIITSEHVRNTSYDKN